jgi:hypothetical protein
MMFSRKMTAMALSALFIIIVFDACAQWSPGGEMVYMGDLNLAASSVPGGGAAYAIGGSHVNVEPLNNTSINSTLLNNNSYGMNPLDLSRYASDRTNKNLTGYKNIMYPISGSRGTTTSTAGGGGSCGCS